MMTWQATMSLAGKMSFQIMRKSPRKCGCRLAVAFSLALSMHPVAMTAQQLPPLYLAGDAAVTGFSGARPPAQIAPGVDPVAKTLIDLNGPSLRIVDLH